MNHSPPTRFSDVRIVLGDGVGNRCAVRVEEIGRCKHFILERHEVCDDGSRSRVAEEPGHVRGNRQGCGDLDSNRQRSVPQRAEYLHIPQRPIHNVVR